MKKTDVGVFDDFLIGGFGEVNQPEGTQNNQIEAKCVRGVFCVILKYLAANCESEIANGVCLQGSPSKSIMCIMATSFYSF